MTIPRPARSAFRLLDRGLDTLCGSFWQRLKWKLSYRAGRIPEFADLIKQPHRQIVCDAVLALRPASVLEIGCGRGANLLLLGKRQPGLRLAGTDVSGSAINDARHNLAPLWDAPVQLKIESLDALSVYPDECFDVVLSDAVMMYVPPDAVLRTVSQMRRVARLGIVISAWHGQPAYDEGTWIYDYTQFGPAEIKRFPSEVWQDARWRRYGAIVTFKS